MSTGQELRHDISRAWSHLREGWTRLYDQASSALTRFTHRGPGDERRPLGHRLDPRGRSRAPAWGEVLASGGWGVLAADVSDDEDRVIVRIEAPGMDKEDLDLRVEHGDLVVRGEKRVEREASKGRYQVTECAYGHFERRIPLPDAVLSEHATARYRHGVLHVELPKDASRKRAPIQVKVH